MQKQKINTVFLLLTQGLAALGFGLLMRFVLVDITGASVLLISGLFIAFIIWGANLVLIGLFVQPYSAYLIGLMFALSAFFFLFDTGQWQWFVGAIAILLVAGNYMRWKLQMDKDLLRKLQLRRMIPRALPRFFTVIALVIAILYFVSPQFGQDQRIQYTVPRSAFDFVYPFLAPAISSAVNDPTNENTVLIDPRGSINLQSLGLSIQHLPAEIRELLPQNFSPGANINVKDLVYEGINRQLNLMLGTTAASVLPAFVAAGLFLGIKALSIPLTWIIIPVTAGVIELLLRFGILIKTSDKREAETIEL